MPLPRDFCIISGGQTGADRAALDFAIRTGIPHGGWCPRGRLAEDGALPPIYQLEETTSSRYDQRTRWNVRDSDATLLLTIDRKIRGGTGLTAKVASQLGKPWLHISRDTCPSPAAAGAQIVDFIGEHNATKLNIAGPRGSQQPEILSFVDAVLNSALMASQA
ncbi:MAG: putative molybdenum carrier protein [Pirellulales bacterium]|nr:putative molybdenum carrier protein [Pirellulales bacterium]